VVGKYVGISVVGISVGVSVGVSVGLSLDEVIVKHTLKKKQDSG
jgi:hypothetical protein